METWYQVLINMTVTFVKKNALGVINVSWVRLQTEKTHTQTAKPGSTTCRLYKYLFRAGIQPAARSRSATVGHSTTALTQFYFHNVIWLKKSLGLYANLRNQPTN